MKIQQFVLTRFNVRYESILSKHCGGSWKGGDADYLERRFDLFERYCLPSLLRQRGPFRWLVFFSALTPEPYREKARSYARICKWYEPVFLDDAVPLSLQASFDAVMKSIVDRLDPDADHYAVSRVDNDDALNVDALDWILEEATRGVTEKDYDRFYVVMPHGNAYIEKGGFTQDYAWDWNHFPTLVCRRDVFDHPFSMSHAEIGNSGIPVLRVNRRHAWLEVVNGTNVVNNLRVGCRPAYLGSRRLHDLFAIRVKASRLGFVVFWLMRYLPARIFRKDFKRKTRQVT